MRTLVTFVALAFCAASAGAADKIPVLIDTDIGSDLDDALALALAVASPEIELVGVTTVGSAADDRAWMVCRFLTQTGVRNVPVAIGEAPPKLKNYDREIDWQIQYRRHPAAIYNRTLKPVVERAPALMARLAKEHNGKLVVVCLGPLTNVAKFVTDHPAEAKQLARIVVQADHSSTKEAGATVFLSQGNIEFDPPAAKTVFASGLPLVALSNEIPPTILERPAREKLFSARTMLTFQVQNLYELWDEDRPVLFDPIAVAAVFRQDGLVFRDQQLEVEGQWLRFKKGPPNARVVGLTKDAKFADWYVDRVRAFGEATPPTQVRNASKLIEPGLFPARVHVAEDYNTDIEKRWWMCGKGTILGLRPLGVRAQRGVLTQDFDDRQGNLKTMERAVIFNPVPGPPMGPRTRLRFAYKLTGADTMRVQLFSLTNNYHRYLSVSGLEQGKWLEGCVDMTDMRRPDGSGGPLAADERIDDIQFYVDPQAELLIDDVMLYDAAVDGEKRPFPARVVFTGWFDTGKQGKEWPGDFEMVAHEAPRTWKFAKSVKGPEAEPLLRVSLRGARKLDARTELTFQYKLTGAEAIDVDLRLGGKAVASERVPLERDAWKGASVRFYLPGSMEADEILFRLPQGAELGVDDVLLFTPGK
jgi:inosine-uridine nucleoside N-ribohydrolase